MNLWIPTPDQQRQPPFPWQDPGKERRETPELPDPNHPEPQPKREDRPVHRA